jgi:hypothetical protein
MTTTRVLLDAATRAVETATEDASLTVTQRVTAAVLRALSDELSTAPADWPDPTDLDRWADEIERGEV